RLQANERAGVLTETRVRCSNHGALGDTGHPLQQLLHLRRADVLTAADDDVLLAVGDRVRTVLVAYRDVTARVPAVRVDGGLREDRVRVADEQVRAARPDLARALFHVVAVVVDESDVDAGQRDAIGVIALWLRVVERRAGRRRVLGAPVRPQQLDAE